MVYRWDQPPDTGPTLVVLLCCVPFFGVEKLAISLYFPLYTMHSSPFFGESRGLAGAIFLNSSILTS